MQIHPYIFFHGNCEEALNFYRTALGGEIIQLMRVSEAPENSQCPITDPDKILHAALRLGSNVVMMSDGLSEPPPPVATYSLSLIAPTVAQGEAWFGQLSEGGDITMPFSKTFWSEGFGMLTDKFGIRWMVNTEA